MYNAEYKYISKNNVKNERGLETYRKNRNFLNCNKHYSPILFFAIEIYRIFVDKFSLICNMSIHKIQMLQKKLIKKSDRKIRKIQ